jgi:hypothetical protein
MTHDSTSNHMNLASTFKCNVYTKRNTKARKITRGTNIHENREHNPLTPENCPALMEVGKLTDLAVKLTDKTDAIINQ